MGIVYAAAEMLGYAKNVKETQKQLSNERPHYRRVAAMPGLGGRVVAIGGGPSGKDPWTLSAAFQIDLKRLWLLGFLPRCEPTITLKGAEYL